ncbi:hypothetical protein AAGF08_08115 [Algoriphagus sp. SE2]|uniref:hypothetical protein n=1 Tax=Algoriphagus sp. SE2 TaxID=3141536 RepID=UPI0031CCECD8
MTGLTVLDVFISLVFVYLLYSLFAMTVIESITSAFGSRSKNLQTGIDRLLSDDKNSSRWNHTILNLFYSFATNSFTKTFYKHPSIKYLGHKGINTKPSYISADRFSSTLVDILRKGLHEEPQDNISTALGDLLPFDIKALKERIAKLLEDLKNLQANDPTNTFEIESTKEELDFLNADLQKRLNEFPKFLNETLNIDPDTKYQLKNLWDEASDDIDKFSGLVSNWYEEQMDRITGWYKRKVTYFTFIVGFIIAVLFNVDTIHLVKDLSTNETMRTLLVNSAQEFIANNPDGITDVSKNGQKQYIEDVKEEMDNYNSILASNKNDNYPAILGWLITAFAISLGAPFWFDMLNKIMKVRPSIPIPANSEQQVNASGSNKAKAVG